MVRIWLCMTLASLSILSCERAPRSVLPSFYHWKTQCSVGGEEKRLLDTLGVSRLYVRFFDVDWNTRREEAVPLASVRLNQAALRGREVVPTVYITNRTMLNISEENLPILAQRITDRIYHLADSTAFGEIQLDCDWTPKSQEAFFQLTDYIRAFLPDSQVDISSTIRLHQVKYAETTGVPPVDRGMLMFYNMGDVADPDTHNSILDLETASDYLDNLDEYPLPLDIALPVFGWGVLIRNRKPIQLLNTLRRSQLSDEARFDFVSPHQVKVIKSTFLNGDYLYEGDVIRLETVSLEELTSAVDILSTHLEQDTIRVSLYHLDTPTLEHYSHEELATVFQRFR